MLALDATNDIKATNMITANTTPKKLSPGAVVCFIGGTSSLNERIKGLPIKYRSRLQRDSPEKAEMIKERNRHLAVLALPGGSLHPRLRLLLLRFRPYFCLAQAFTPGKRTQFTIDLAPLGAPKGAVEKFTWHHFPGVNAWARQKFPKQRNIKTHASGWCGFRRHTLTRSMRFSVELSRLARRSSGRVGIF